MAGGGSAGHVNPLLAVSAKLAERGTDVLALGTKVGLEAELVPQAGFELLTIDKIPAPRRPGLAALQFLPKLRRTIARVEEYLREREVDAVMGFGGYVSAPAYLAARRQKIPTLIHEQNVRAGWANKLGARSADRVGLTFANTKLRARRGRTEVTGLPLRTQIERLAKLRQNPQSRTRVRENAAKKLHLDPNQPTLLITGGSLGAKHLNEVMVAAASAFDKRLQVLHLTGKGKSEGVEQAVRSCGFEGRWIVREYASNMADFFAASDLVVCRSGAGTVCELTALGIPAVYVPLPIGNGEQKLNAAAQVQAGGAYLFADSEFDESVVQNWVAPLLASPSRLESMAAASAQLGRVDAAGVLADMVSEVLHERAGAPHTPGATDTDPDAKEAR